MKSSYSPERGELDQNPRTLIVIELNPPSGDGSYVHQNVVPPQSTTRWQNALVGHSNLYFGRHNTQHGIERKEGLA